MPGRGAKSPPPSSQIYHCVPPPVTLRLHPMPTPVTWSGDGNRGWGDLTGKQDRGRGRYSPRVFLPVWRLSQSQPRPFPSSQCRSVGAAGTEPTCKPHPSTGPRFPLPGGGGSFFFLPPFPKHGTMAFASHRDEEPDGFAFPTAGRNAIVP